MPSYIRRCGLALTMTVIAISSAWAGGEGTLLGDWHGTTKTSKGNDVDVTLHIESLKPGEGGTVLMYGGPRSCQLDASYSETKGGKQYFSFGLANGGYCDRLSPGKLVVQQTGPNSISYQVIPRQKEYADSGQLTQD